MKLDDVNARDNVERLYIAFVSLVKQLKTSLTPYFRMVLRFIFLPYCYFFLVNWKECNASRFRVAKDFLYIFFVLKDFPDHYFPCKLWEKDKSDWPLYWGSNYNPWQRHKLSREVQNPQYEIVYEDKQLCYDLCKAKAIRVPEQLDIIDRQTHLPTKIKAIFSNNPDIERVIIKPLNGKGGHGINVFHRKDVGTPEYSSGVYNEYSVSRSAIQEYVSQEGSVAEFSNSLNTIRCVTLMSKRGDVQLIGAYMRFGGAGSLVDNLSKGGVAVPICLDNGRLRAFGLDRKGRRHEFHPGSRRAFKDFAIPFWVDVIETAKKVQADLPYYRLLGMDIGISKKGPVLIEVNAIYDNIDFEQVCGPILAEPFAKKVFKEYSLFYNRKQKNL